MKNLKFADILKKKVGIILLFLDLSILGYERAYVSKCFDIIHENLDDMNKDIDDIGKSIKQMNDDLTDALYKTDEKLNYIIYRLEQTDYRLEQKNCNIDLLDGFYIDENAIKNKKIKKIARKYDY